MARVREEWAKRRARDARKASRRAPSELFPSAGPEADEAREQFLAREQTRAEETNARSAELCTRTDPCDWCDPITPYDPDGPGLRLTARVLVTPAKYSPGGHLIQHAIYGYACFEHCKKLRLRPGTSDNARTTVTEREKYATTVRADARKEHKAAQLPMFGDERLNTDPITGG